MASHCDQKLVFVLRKNSCKFLSYRVKITVIALVFTPVMRHTHAFSKYILNSVTHLSYVGTGLAIAGSGSVENNSIVLASNTGRFGKLFCLSGSLQPHVGAWLAPNGSDITNSTTDRLDVNLGGEDYPGSISMEVEIGYSLGSNDQGVYTCTIPDENGEQQYLHVGIYSYGFNGESLNFSWGSSIVATYTCSLSLLSHSSSQGNNSSVGFQYKLCTYPQLYLDWFSCYHCCVDQEWFSNSC